jgi:hypothetical protein
MLNCDKCTQAARWRITTASKSLRRNKYGCDEHKAELKSELEGEIANLERQSGNPFYPTTSTLGLGEIEVVPLQLVQTV